MDTGEYSLGYKAFQNGSLVINEVKFIHNGTYRVEVRNKAGSTFHDVELSMQIIYSLMRKFVSISAASIFHMQRSSTQSLFNRRKVPVGGSGGTFQIIVCMVLLEVIKIIIDVELFSWIIEEREQSIQRILNRSKRYGEFSFLLNKEYIPCNFIFTMIVF